MRWTKAPTKQSTRWIAWLGILGGLGSSGFQLLALVVGGSSDVVVSVVALVTSAALVITGLWAKEIAATLPS